MQSPPVSTPTPERVAADFATHVVANGGMTVGTPSGSDRVPTLWTVHRTVATAARAGRTRNVPLLRLWDGYDLSALVWAATTDGVVVDWDHPVHGIVNVVPAVPADVLHRAISDAGWVPSDRTPSSPQGVWERMVPVDETDLGGWD